MATAEAPDLETPEPEWLTEVGYPGAACRHQEGRPVAGRSTIARRSNSGHGPPGCRCHVSASSWFSTGGKREATEPYRREAPRTRGDERGMENEASNESY